MVRTVGEEVLERGGEAGSAVLGDEIVLQRPHDGGVLPVDMASEDVEASGCFLDLADVAVRNGVHPERIARMGCMRPLQRMGEEIGDDELGRFDALAATMEREFASLQPEASREARDAAVG